MTRMPLWRDPWEERRATKFERCKTTRKLIWPGQKAYCQVTFWGLSNDDVNKPEREEVWLTPAAHTFRQLKS